MFASHLHHNLHLNTLRGKRFAKMDLLEQVQNLIASSATLVLFNSNEDTHVFERLNSNDPPREILRKMLSAEFVVSAPSASVETLRDSESGTLLSFRTIGKGSCGIVFEQPGTTLVIKRALQDSEALWNDFKTHARVMRCFDQFHQHTTDVHIPRVYRFQNSQEKDWWQTNAQHFTHEAYRAPGNLLFSERIPPLPEVVQKALIDEYCPPIGRAEARALRANKDCLVRLYLGSRRDRSWTPRFFSLRNYCLHVDQMEDLGLDVQAFASAIAEALAVMHWGARTDADDVEFVLGGTPTAVNDRLPTDDELDAMPANASTVQEGGVVNSKRRSVHVWLLDFDKCNRISMDGHGVEMAVRAFFKNDPYFPRPCSEHFNDQDLWRTFAERYISVGKIISEGQAAVLPEIFILMVEEEMKRRMQARGKSM
ncbi:hypothetical protein MMC20_001776 [Loxospora ochrophaea]|nr:hypothetical protein [Loxospora ochrophaea]